MAPSCGRLLGEEEEKKEVSYFMEFLGGEEVVRVDFILVDRHPHDVQEEERNTAEDQEVFKIQRKV